jgi:acyl-CoA thioester hydrolase
MHDSHSPLPLVDFPVRITWPVQWGDQDAFGHVNNTVYFRWFESGRIAYFERLGLRHTLSDAGPGPILAAINCNFRRPIGFPDTVHIGTRITKVGNSSLTLAQTILSERLQTIAADGDSVIVLFDYRAQTPIRIPEDLRTKIAALEAWAS